ncbi:Transposon Tf2-6 polyprotein [Labeo rohita]|uniref:ribonuclease H n=1 Tax=Labeo rohita TaxID=84645 RepID=A0ABQ8LNL9_LABRO|nr:Transposon Tf2-6 polyprotein [Labeo rohita]
MEAASATPSLLEEFIRASVSRMDAQDKSMNESGQAIRALVVQVSELTQRVQQLQLPAAPPTPSTPPTPLVPSNAVSQSEPRLPTPELYSGEPNFCRAFLTRCSMHFSLQPRTFASEESKVAFVLTLLTGRAALWGTAVWENQDPCCASFQTLSAEMKRGERSVSDYSIEFRTLAAECQWNEEAQWDMFLHGLADRVQNEIYALDLPDTLNGLIDLALRVDSRLSRAERRRLPVRLPPGETSTLRASGGDAVSPVYDHEPMQLPGKRASPAVSLRLLSGGISATKTSSRSTSTLLPVRLSWSDHSHDCSALLDSGAEGNFMDYTFAHKIQAPLLPLTHTIAVHALNGQTLPTISFTTEPITLTVSGNHRHPWLTKHNPRIDWQQKSEKAVDLCNVPTEYLDLKEVFSKSRAASLPPHRPYDCAMELLPGTSPPKGKLYSLSVPEREAMEKYISDSLAAGFIRPSSSPAGAGFFFVGKKDAFERLQGASVFTKLDLRNAYHLVRIRRGDEWKTAFNTPRGHFEYLVMPFGLSNSPGEHVQHVRRVFQRLLENGLFVKAEKCDFHAHPFLGYIVSSEGMRMDPEKVKAVVDWPSSDSCKALQRFLGFANFYRRFIRNFSQLASPLTALTSPRTTFRWSDAAEAAFAKLKSCFVLAPILVTPDPSRQFVVEVDASEVGVGAVLSQRSPTDDRMHPCAFFSHRLSPAETMILVTESCWQSS